jgi:hypothetical protein
MDAGALSAVLGDRRRFISRLRFEDATANVASFSRPFSEQRALIEALMDSSTRSVVVLKPRQIGITTANCAETFWETYAATKPLRTIVAADHNKTTKSIFKKFTTYYNFLPAALKSANPFKINQNDKTLISERSGALIDHMTARGNAHGRGWTYQRMIAEELAFWTHPEDVWAGLRSTLHEGPDTKIIIVSTPNGPGNFYHERVLNAMEAERNGDESTKFIFSRWSDHSTYRLDPPSSWEPDEEEWQLKQLYELDMSQLYWRHEMIHGVEGMGERRFRREFPLTVEDGFIVLEGCWFDSDYLNDRLHDLPNELRSELRVYLRPDMGVSYVIGCDPSWCTGGDFAVACVLDEYGNQCAVLSIQHGGEDRFCEELTNLSRYYNNARVLCEANTGGAGRIVIKALLREGTPIWRDQHGKDWTTSRGNKEMAYGNARQLLNGDAFLLNDHASIQELMHVREVKGRIEGQDGYHDDHADAFVLAVWALRTCPGWQGKPKYSRREFQGRRNPADRIRSAIR